MGKVVKVIFIILMLGVLLYLGTCTYANFFTKPPSNLPDTPGIKEAKYAVRIENTGNVYLTNSYDILGKTIILHGHWELVGKNYKYIKGDLPIDQSIFGPVTVNIRKVANVNGK
jgi:hypothetical protein